MVGIHNSGCSKVSLDVRVFNLLQWGMTDARLSTIKPSAIISCAGGSEGRSRQLLSIEAKRAFLRAILANWKTSFDRFALESVSEARLNKVIISGGVRNIQKTNQVLVFFGARARVKRIY